MSKSNVNPNHYKVAGRERQGEDIAQARNKQEHAESVVAGAEARAEPGSRQRRAPREISEGRAPRRRPAHGCGTES